MSGYGDPHRKGKFSTKDQNRGKKKSMENIFGVNGLIFWSEDEIKLRSFMIDTFARRVQNILLGENPAWRFIQIEAPLLTPVPLLNPNYTNEDVWFQGHHGPVQDPNTWLALRPETTPGSYAYAAHMLDHHTGIKPPLCVWQAGKSFRREQDQVTKNMRLKEFYQQEFQCIYAADTMNDYHSAVLRPIADMLAEMIGLSVRLVPSDRLPSYSETTMDVEVDNGDKWMEICSISRRLDFPDKLRFQGKNGVVEKDALVLEIAIGLDRCLYNYQSRVELS